jgi:hypothetical protein
MTLLAVYHHQEGPDNQVSLFRGKQSPSTVLTPLLRFLGAWRIRSKPAACSVVSVAGVLVQESPEAWG